MKLYRACLLCLVTAWLLPLAEAPACNVPVFRFALERWRADPYQVTVFHRGKLAAEDQALVDDLQKAADTSEPLANCTVEVVDVAAPLKGPLAELWKAQKAPALPWLLVRYPDHGEDRPPMWAGPLSAEDVRGLTDSPARRQIVRQLLAGDAVVWVLLESGTREKDEAASRLVQGEIARLEKSLKLPEGAGEDPGDLLSPLPLKLRFSMLRLTRGEPAEKMFVAMLLGTEEGLGQETEPIAFPVFGRGRVLAALVGKGLNAEVLEDAAGFLCGACSCLVKRLNPGTDLLMAADWDAVLAEAAPAEPESAPAGEMVPIPQGTKAASAAVQEEPAPQAQAPARQPGLPRNFLLAAIGLASLCVVVSGAIAWKYQRRNGLSGGAGQDNRNIQAPGEIGGADGTKVD